MLRIKQIYEDFKNKREGEVVEFQNYCKDSDYVIEYGSELGVHKGIWKYIKKDALVCLEVESLERQLAEARELIDDCLSEIKANYDYDFEEYTMLKERLMQLKDKGDE